MPYLLLGLAILVLLLYGARLFVRADPKTLARNLRRYGGIGAIVLAVILTAIGRGGYAVPLFLVGSMLLGRGAFAGFPFPGSSRKSSGQTSRVRTSMIEMELDHDSGDMDGTVLAGNFTGRSLSSLAADECLSLWRDVCAADANGAQLLEAYLDRMHEGWREQAGEPGAKSGRNRPHADSGPMSPDEAYEILGLRPGAGKQDVRKAHRELMKRLHPDHGGSTYLAAQINQAKDILLKALE